MKTNKFLLIILLLSFFSCTKSPFAENKHIQIERIFEIKDKNFYVYFYSKYCGNCKIITNDLQTMYLENLYYINLDQISSDSFNQMKIIYSPLNENIEEYINITSLTDMVFYSAPCIYFFENIDNKTTLTYIYHNEESIKQLITSWR